VLVLSACFHVYQGKVDKLVDEHLSFLKVLSTLSSPKGLGSPSLGAPIIVFRLSLGFKASKIKHFKVEGVEKIWNVLWTHILSCVIKTHFIIGYDKFHTQTIYLGYYQTM